MKRQICILLIVALLVSLIGCGRSEERPERTEPQIDQILQKVTTDLTGQWCFLTVDGELVNFMGFEFDANNSCRSFVGDVVNEGTYVVGLDQIVLSYLDSENQAIFEYTYENGIFLLKLQDFEYWHLYKITD